MEKFEESEWQKVKFKFYVEDQNEDYIKLYCKDECGRLFWFDVPGHALGKWVQLIKYDNCELREISEKEAQDICNGRAYTAEVWLNRKHKKRHVKSLLKLSNTQISTFVLLATISVIIVFGLPLLMCVILGTPIENVGYFFAGTVIFGFLSLLAEKITGFEGEGCVIVIGVGIVVYILTCIF